MIDLSDNLDFGFTTLNSKKQIEKSEPSVVCLYAVKNL